MEDDYVYPISSPQQLQSFLNESLESGASAAATLVDPTRAVAAALARQVPHLVPISAIDASESPVRPFSSLLFLFLFLFLFLLLSLFGSSFVPLFSVLFLCSVRTPYRRLCMMPGLRLPPPLPRRIWWRWWSAKVAWGRHPHRP